ncbi:hypothetical protein PMIN03_013078, partial [Paraphaeosphaeria minitans]
AWENVRRIFKIRFATWLPFFDTSVDVDKFRQRREYRSIDQLFFAVLALTIPFFETSLSQDTSELAQRHAEAAFRLTKSANDSLEKTQTLLMLSLNAVRNGEQKLGFVLRGVAINSMDLCGRPFDKALVHPLERQLPSGNYSMDLAKLDFATQEEVRLTFWSYLLMVICVRPGDFGVRDVAIDESRFLVQLPHRTIQPKLGRGLGESPEEFQQRCHDVKYEYVCQVLEPIIALTDVQQRLDYLAFMQRRRPDILSATDIDAKVASLIGKVDDTMCNLPSSLEMNPTNLNCHISDQTFSSYAILHSTHAMCTMHIL